MTWLQWFLLVLALHLPVLGLLYVLWIQHERGDIWRFDPGWRRHFWWIWKGFHLFGIVGFIPDVLANYITLAAAFYHWPGRAFTFSKHLLPLSRLTGWRGTVANMVADVLDDLAPSGDHIHR